MADPLTGLPQRDAVLDWLMDAPTLSSGAFAVALVNVDGFSVVVESLGIRDSDQILRQVAHRLRGAAAFTGARVARAGGDEFALVLPEVRDEADAERLVAGLVASAFGRSVEVRGQSIYLTASAGVAVSPPHDADELMRRAIATVGVIKRLGGGRTMAFKPRQSVTLGNLELYAELREALDRNQLSVHYQPVVDLESMEAVGLEALLRWHHPVRGVVGPSEFLPPIANSQIIEDLGRWVLEQSCRDVAGLLLRHTTLDYLAVNVAPRQLSDPEFATFVLTSLREAGVSPRHLVLEITEVDIVDDIHAARETLVSLRAQGVRVAIDDFGTGYATLTSLRQLPVDILKIDRTFVAGVEDSDDDARIIASVAALAASIGLEPVAEGVETQAQADAVRALGCIRAQGYLWSHPVPRGDVSSIIDRLGKRRRTRSGPEKRDLSGPGETRRILELYRGGASPHTIAAALNAAGLRTSDGRRWHSARIMQILDEGRVGL